VPAAATAAVFALRLGFGVGVAGRVVRTGALGWVNAVRGAGAEVTAAGAGAAVRVTGSGGGLSSVVALRGVVAASGASGVGASGIGVIAAEGAVVV
jgi:hypothetical protein